MTAQRSRATKTSSLAANWGRAPWRDPPSGGGRGNRNERTGPPPHPWGGSAMRPGCNVVCNGALGRRLWPRLPGGTAPA
eukprot:11164230-Lingulodinium_polyedra.AAC.1